MNVAHFILRAWAYTWRLSLICGVPALGIAVLHARNGPVKREKEGPPMSEYRKAILASHAQEVWLQYPTAAQLAERLRRETGVLIFIDADAQVPAAQPGQLVYVAPDVIVPAAIKARAPLDWRVEHDGIHVGLPRPFVYRVYSRGALPRPHSTGSVYDQEIEQTVLSLILALSSPPSGVDLDLVIVGDRILVGAAEDDLWAVDGAVAELRRYYATRN